jgi:hypothetical protein
VIALPERGRGRLIRGAASAGVQYLILADDGHVHSDYQFID